MINLKQIETFVAVYEYGSVTKAADNLHVTQSAVSRMLLRLERDLRFDLFVRLKGRLIPTDESIAFYAEIQRNYLGIREITRAAERIRELGTGTLKLCVMPTLSQGVVPDLVASFFRMNPGISVTFEVQTYGEVSNWVKRGLSEIGFATLPVDEKSFAVTRLASTAAVCLVPKSNPLAEQAWVSLEDLDGSDYISVPLARFRATIDRAFHARGIRRNIRIETRTILSAVSLVAGGAGVTIVDPFSLVSIHNERIAALPLRPEIRIDVGLFTNRDLPLSPLAARFIAFCQEELAGERSKALCADAGG